jgi:hypothetical protein
MNVTLDRKLKIKVNYNTREYQIKLKIILIMVSSDFRSLNLLLFKYHQ